MSVLDLYQQYGIPTAPEGHKHYRTGWVNIACPFCDAATSDKYFLGFNLESGYYYCWRCGSHPVKATIAKLLKLPTTHVEEILSSYRLKQRSRAVDAINSNQSVKIGKKLYKHPSDTSPLKSPHYKYLLRRGFDPDYLISDWGVLGTGPTSTLDGLSYKFRIFVPIIWHNKEVSFLCRDYTGKQSKKYMVCPEHRETIHHKHILYGHPDLWKRREGIVVEGAFDVWRFEGKACGTLGTGYTREQVSLLSKLFDRLVIMFDPEPVAQQRAKKLQAELSFRGVRTTVYGDLPSDPGDLSQDDATYILKELKL